MTIVEDSYALSFSAQVKSRTPTCQQGIDTCRSCRFAVVRDAQDRTLTSQSNPFASRNERVGVEADQPGVGDHLLQCF